MKNGKSFYCWYYPVQVKLFEEKEAAMESSMPVFVFTGCNMLMFFEYLTKIKCIAKS